MIIALGADPWGLQLKEAVKKHLQQKKFEIIDFGSFPGQDRPYYEAASDAALAVQQKRADRGIVFCGTGMGVAIVANKYKGIYAAVIESEYAAYKCKQINNANVLAMGGMFLSEFKALLAVDNWLSVGHTEGMDHELAAFLENSLEKIAEIENTNMK